MCWVCLVLGVLGSECVFIYNIVSLREFATIQLVFYYLRATFPVTVEILREGTRQGGPVEMSTKSPLAQALSLGSDQMGLYRFDGDERCVRNGGHTRQLRWIQ